MSDINRVILMGHLGKVPEVRTTKAGAVFCVASLATNTRGKRRGADWERITDWHRLVAFGELATQLRELGPGTVVGVEGVLTYSTYQVGEEYRKNSEVVVGKIFYVHVKGQSRPATPEDPWTDEIPLPEDE